MVHNDIERKQSIIYKIIVDYIIVLVSVLDLLIMKFDHYYDRTAIFDLES